MTRAIADLTDRDLRQRELVPPDALAACHILVIGVGAIGRQVAVQLAAMGAAAITLVDHDQVDVVNLAVQGYTPEDLAIPKVQATASWCSRINPEVVIHTCAERFRRSSTKTLECFRETRRLAVFCCVDSMSARQMAWESVKSRCGFFADARMAAEALRVLAVADPAGDGYYANTLFAQDQAYSGSCTARSTIYGGAIAAGFMLSQFTRWLRRLPVDRDLLLNLLAGELTAS